MSLPLPIKDITKHFKNIRLISYSKHMKRRRLSYSEMLTFAGTEDACTDYDAKSDAYIIYYNDYDSKKMSTNRYRWNIAHELGHVMLEHHKKHAESRIYRNQLGECTYKTLESEADMYAAYILVPHIVLSCLEVKEDFEIAKLCRVSDTASLYRASNMHVWMKRKKVTQYDFSILSLFSHYVESEHQNEKVRKWLVARRICKFCYSTLTIFSYNYCPICGKYAEPNYVRRKDIMQYPGIDTDDDSRALECPICHNTDLYKSGNVCIICGQDLVNYCSSADSDDPFAPKCSYHEPLPGNARYCPHCGSKATFYVKGHLTSWNGEDDSDDSGELPF